MIQTLTNNAKNKMTNTNLKLIETFYDKAKTKVKERYFVDKDGKLDGLYELFYKDGLYELFY